jgi:hypothetical protein
MIDAAAWQDAARRALDATSLADVQAIAAAVASDPARDGTGVAVATPRD